MAGAWQAKRADETVIREWTPFSPDRGSIASASVTATGATATSAIYGDVIRVTLSGGVNGTPATVVITARSSLGETEKATFYLPVQDDASALQETAQDFVTSALRKIVGIGETPDSDLATFALEAFNDMLAEWKGRGMDVGAQLPLTMSSVLLIPDEFVSGIRSNLTLALCDQFERPVTETLQRQAMIGFELISRRLKPSAAVEYF